MVALALSVTGHFANVVVACRGCRRLVSLVRLGLGTLEKLSTRFC